MLPFTPVVQPQTLLVLQLCKDFSLAQTLTVACTGGVLFKGQIAHLLLEEICFQVHLPLKFNFSRLGEELIFVHPFSGREQYWWLHSAEKIFFSTTEIQRANCTRTPERDTRTVKSV